MECAYCKELLYVSYDWKIWRQRSSFVFCKKCMENITLESIEHRCPRCMKKSKVICSDCRRWERLGFTLKNYSMLDYTAFWKLWMIRWKMYGDSVLIKLVSSELKQFIKLHLDQKKFTFVIVPLHQNKKKERGFNPSYLLAKEMGVTFYDPFEKALDITQSKSNRKERLKRANPFRWKVDAFVPKSLPVIIIDDLYTTGQTIQFIASLLTRNGYEVAGSMTLFRA